MTTARSIKFSARDIKNTSRPPPSCQRPHISFEKWPQSHHKALIFSLVYMDSSLSFFHVCGHFHLVDFFLFYAVLFWLKFRVHDYLRWLPRTFSVYSLHSEHSLSIHTIYDLWCFWDYHKFKETKGEFSTLSQIESSGSELVSKSITIIKGYLKQMHS